MRVGHGLGRGEGLGGDEEQRALGLELAQHEAQLHAIDVGDEVHALARMAQLFERLDGHRRAQVGAADADVDHVGDGVVGAHALGQLQHRVQRGVDVLEAVSHRARYIFSSMLPR